MRNLGYGYHMITPFRGANLVVCTTPFSVHFRGGWMWVCSTFVWEWPLSQGVRSWIQETGQVRNVEVFSWGRYLFKVCFDISKMIHQQMKATVCSSGSWWETECWPMDFAWGVLNFHFGIGVLPNGLQMGA